MAVDGTGKKVGVSDVDASGRRLGGLALSHFYDAAFAYADLAPTRRVEATDGTRPTMERSAVAIAWPVTDGAVADMASRPLEVHLTRQSD